MSAKAMLMCLVLALACISVVGPADARPIMIQGPLMSGDEADCDAWDNQMQRMQSDVERRHQACLDSPACKVSHRHDSSAECSCPSCEELHEEMTSYSRGDISRIWKTRLQECRVAAQTHQRHVEEVRRSNDLSRQQQLDTIRRAQVAQDARNSAIQNRNNQIYNNAMANQRATQQAMANINQQFAALAQQMANGNDVPLNTPRASRRAPPDPDDQASSPLQNPSDFSVSTPAPPNLLADEIAKIQQEVMTCAAPVAGGAYSVPGLTISYSTSCNGTSTVIEFLVQNTGTGDAAVQFNWEGQSRADSPSQSYGNFLGVGRLNAGASTRLYGSVLNQDLPVNVRVFNVKYCDIASATAGADPSTYVSPCARVPGGSGRWFPIDKGSSG